VPSKVGSCHHPGRRKFADQNIADGSVGGAAQKVGGPFDKEGAVGKQFTEGGALGGIAQSAAETAQGEKPSAFDAKGMIGKQFTSQSSTIIPPNIANLLFIAEGAIGGTAQKVGGPFDKEGIIGKQFNTDGALGGSVQGNLGDKKK
jgi:hypothetical protein